MSKRSGWKTSFPAVLKFVISGWCHLKTSQPRQCYKITQRFGMLKTPPFSSVLNLFFFFNLIIRTYVPVKQTYTNSSKQLITKNKTRTFTLKIKRMYTITTIKQGLWLGYNVSLWSVVTRLHATWPDQLLNLHCKVTGRECKRYEISTSQNIVQFF